jgi:hypothetical protein
MTPWATKRAPEKQSQSRYGQGWQGPARVPGSSAGSTVRNEANFSGGTEAGVGRQNRRRRSGRDHSYETKPILHMERNGCGSAGQEDRRGRVQNKANLEQDDGEGKYWTRKGLWRIGPARGSGKTKPILRADSGVMDLEPAGVCRPQVSWLQVRDRVGAAFRTSIMIIGTCVRCAVRHMGSGSSYVKRAMADTVVLIGAVSDGRPNRDKTGRIPSHRKGDPYTTISKSTPPMAVRAVAGLSRLGIGRGRVPRRLRKGYGSVRTGRG